VNTRLDAGAELAQHLDTELVTLIAETYRSMVEGFIPDLAYEAGGNEYDLDVSAHCDSIYDLTIDRLYDEEIIRRKSSIDVDHLRAAAQQITIHFCGNA